MKWKFWKREEKKPESKPEPKRYAPRRAYQSSNYIPPPTPAAPVDNSGFLMGMVAGQIMSIPHTRHDDAPTFQAGGGSYGGAGASSDWGSSSSSSDSSSSSCDSGSSSSCGSGE